MGLALEVPDDTLQSVRQNHSADPDTMKLLKIIDHWLKLPNADWAALIKTIESPLVNNKQIADDIRKFVTESITM